MCLVTVALSCSDTWRLVVAFNRDEYFDRSALAYWLLCRSREGVTKTGTRMTLACMLRATAPLHQLDQEGDCSIYAGVDLQGQGTWLGISSTGRFAFVTNFREVNHRLLQNNQALYHSQASGPRRYLGTSMRGHLVVAACPWTFWGAQTAR